MDPLIVFFVLFCIARRLLIESISYSSCVAVNQLQLSKIHAAFVAGVFFFVFLAICKQFLFDLNRRLLASWLNARHICSAFRVSLSSAMPHTRPTFVELRTNSSSSYLIDVRLFI